MRQLRLFAYNLRHRLRMARLRKLRAQRPPKPPPGPPRVDFSYTIYWTKQVRRWSPERRAEVRAALADRLRQPGFEPNAFERRYQVAGLDDEAHSGASLVALQKVLAAFIQAASGPAEDNDPGG